MPKSTQHPFVDHVLNRLRPISVPYYWFTTRKSAWTVYSQLRRIHNQLYKEHGDTSLGRVGELDFADHIAVVANSIARTHGYPLI